jgi:hypothetical protein
MRGHPAYPDLGKGCPKLGVKFSVGLPKSGYAGCPRINMFPYSIIWLISSIWNGLDSMIPSEM